MKLVEIKDVRVGQIWDNGNNFLIITGFSEYEPEMVHSVTYVPEDKPITLKSGKKVAGLMYSSTSKNSLEGSKLIGKLGITHRIEDGKLVEIPREDLVVDDIVEYLDFDGFKVTAVIASLITGMTREDSQYGFITNDGNFDESSLFEREEIGEDSGTFIYTPKKIGILGVTHEFVNDREA